MATEIFHIVRNRCIDLINELKLPSSCRYFTLPLIRYILSIPYALPIRHVILAERPYGTNIFPYAASAMSYDPELQYEPTPSVNFLALDINNNTDVDYKTAMEWFRDSWKYLKYGIISLNVCTLCHFMDNNSEIETVAIEMFLKDMLNISRKLSSEKIHIYAMGNPARHSAKRIRSSIANSSGSVIVHECSNPAAYKHKVGDQRSPAFTLKTPRLTKLLASLVLSTTGGNLVVLESDYTTMAAGQPNELNNLVGRSSNMKDIFDEISTYFKSNKGKTVERNEELFDRASQEMKEFVLALQSNKVQLLFSNVSEPKNTAKQSYYNSRQSYRGGNYQRGTSSKAPSTLGSARKQKLGFAGEDDEPESGGSKSATTPVTPSNEPLTPTPQRTSAKRSEISTSSHIGFAGESDEEESSMKQPTIFEDPASGNSVLNGEELNDFACVCDFLSENDKEYQIDSVTFEFLDSARTSKRAASGPALELLSIIRQMRKEQGSDAIFDSLGVGNSDKVDVSSDVVQWVLNQKKSS